ncbi:MAG: TetR family transcriptional regulator [Microbacteriaceae bacterium]
MSDQTTAAMRRQPRQNRSEQRIALILDSLAELIDEVGYRNLTIAMIAKRASMSGPGIYRYFDDLNAIARALATRNLDKFLSAAGPRLAETGDDWQAGLASAVDIYCGLFRTEPGFRWLRLGDSVDSNLMDSTESNRTVVARVTGDLFVRRYEVGYRPDLLAHTEVIVEVIDALCARAFEKDPQGDPFFISQISPIINGYLAEYLERTLATSGAPQSLIQS